MMLGTAFTMPVRALDLSLLRAAHSRRMERKRSVVLVVENNVQLRRAMVADLSAHFDVIEADDGDNAIAQYERHAPDAVFIDADIEEESEHTLLSSILAADKTAFIVMLSTHHTKEQILPALQQGAQGFVTYPFTREKLLHYLRICETMRYGQPRTIKEVIL